MNYGTWGIWLSGAGRVNIEGRCGLFQIVNMTEQEMKRVDVRVGLIGALRFMDGSPQGVRQLHHLHSQVGHVLLYCRFGLQTFQEFSQVPRIREVDAWCPVLGKYGMGEQS